MRKLLVLGSDYSTLRVVKEAKNLGMYVIVTDLMETSPSKKEADEAWMVSTTDIDLLVSKCIENNVSAVMFGASDFNINNAREVCKRLNLPIYCENDFSWQVARDKRKFKDLCKKTGVNVAEDYYIDDSTTDDELEKIKYPVVCKPSDKSGNRGMSYCSDSAELKKAYQLAKSISEKPVIVERYLHGQEYNVHYVLADGEARLLYFSSTHHQPGQAENLYSFKCTTSSYLDQYVSQMNESVKKLIHEAGCREGIVWFDCIRDDDGKFYLLEMGYRFGGVMTYVPYTRVSGFNTIRWMVECAAGVKHTKEDMPRELDYLLKGCAGSYHLFTSCGGEIEQIEGLDELEKLPNVYIDMPKREGSSVRKLACSGLIGIYGRDIEELCQTLEKVNSLLKIRNKDGDNMFIVFDDYESLKKEYYKGLKEYGA